ncbi:MAG: aspartate aminotransferase family protein [Acidimicrobiia bacterium]|nr:aspartate aminotransferase family protein [Acidimicrobiia bacterium]
MAVPAFLHPFARPTAEHFVSIRRAEGSLLWDEDGRRYIDAMGSLWYCQVGHGRREIIDAVHDQLGRLDAFHTFEMFTNAPADALCERLAALAPMADARVFLTSSGSEAVDTALKMARRGFALSGAPERTVVIARRRAYHGVTYGGTSAQGIEPNRAHFGPLLDDVIHVDPDDVADLEDAFARHDGRVAAVIVEPVQGAGGVFPPAPGYLAAVRALCDRHGALLIADEVICGFGRLGRWWGVELEDVAPDLVTFAKGVTSGYQPLGGVLVGARLRSLLEADEAHVLRHGFTYSGHPAACAAALANLDIIEHEGLLRDAARIERRLGRTLEAIASSRPAVACRGLGGIWALGLPEGVAAPVLRDAMVARGVIPRPIAEHSIAFCPPLTTSDEILDEIATVTAAALDEVAAQTTEQTT